MSNRINLSLGALYATLDEPREWTRAGGSPWIVPDSMDPGPGRLVHIMSPAAGGEIEAYVLDAHNRLHVRRPNRVLWPGLDAAVCAALGAVLAAPKGA